MAKKRDVIVGVIIVGTIVVVMGLFGLMMIGIMSEDNGADFGSFGESVGVVEMFGIMDENSGRRVIRQLHRWQNNNSIKAIVIHVNTPGGEVSISQELYNTILEVRENDKPVVVAMAAVAASGGYYIACAADRIIANPGTLTGSIGTIFSFYTFRSLFDKVGIESEVIKSGVYKDVGNSAREMTKNEELMLRAVVMDGYEQFVEAIAEGRGMDKEEVYPLADGSLYTGMQAYNLGLVDTLGGLYDAIDIAAELANMEADPRITRPRSREKPTLFDLMGSFLGGIGKSINNRADGPRLLYLYR